jgi:hypothetical protein
MKLDRNLDPVGRGKYAIVKMRAVKPLVEADPECEVAKALRVLLNAGCLEYCNGENDFFVIRLRDRFAGVALRAYSIAAREHDLEYSNEVQRLAEISTEMDTRYPD